MMTIKDAVLLSLEDFPNGATSREVYDNIINKKLFEFSKIAKLQMQLLVHKWGL